MTVYTTLTLEDVRAFVRSRGLADPDALEPVHQGIENTNYRLRAGGRWYALTLFEREPAGRVAETMRIVAALARRGVPCPEPLSGPGGPVGMLADRPAVLVPWVEGRVLARAGPGELRAVGRVLGRLHRAGLEVPVRRGGLHRAGELVPWARDVAARIRGTHPDVARLVEEDAAFQAGLGDRGLPQGLVHADLFLDNVVFAPDAPEVRAVLDPHMAGRGALVYDLAVFLLDAAWGAAGPEPEAARAVVAGYQDVRPMEPVERERLGDYMRRAALRFLCLRIERFWLAADRPQGVFKDPEAFRRKLEVLRDPCFRFAL